jgi:redox-sensitive bicupin YhaK (pirin superfamily)
MNTADTIRTVAQIIPGMPASEGAGVRILRSLGQRGNLRVDPFLMLDEIYSDRAEDYLAGFPSHPHRGFQTLTYMREGHMLHEDHLGNRGDLRTGGAQWMTAGRGIIHSEMPQQTSGRMHGFQLWINLPAAEKMKPAAYRDFQPEEIPESALPGGGRVRVIAGELRLGEVLLLGPMRGAPTDPSILDLNISPGGSCEAPVCPAGYAALVYVYEGSLRIPDVSGEGTVPAHHAAVLSSGSRIRLHAGAEGAGCLVLAAQPLREPVVQYGPFVMNTVAEIEQAIRDYQAGRLVAA